MKFIRGFSVLCFDNVDNISSLFFPIFSCFFIIYTDKSWPTSISNFNSRSISSIVSISSFPYNSWVLITTWIFYRRIIFPISLVFCSVFPLHASVSRSFSVLKTSFIIFSISPKHFSFSFYFSFMKISFIMFSVSKI